MLPAEPPAPDASGPVGPAVALPDPATVDRPWSVSWPPGVPTGWAYPDVGIDRLVADAARDVPDGIAVRDGSHELTWADLAGLVDDVARGLSRRAPDRVVLVCDGALNALVVGLAAWRIGAVLEVVDPTVKRDTLPGATVRDDQDAESTATERPADAEVPADRDARDAGDASTGDSSTGDSSTGDASAVGPANVAADDRDNAVEDVAGEEGVAADRAGDGGRADGPGASGEPDRSLDGPASDGKDGPDEVVLVLVDRRGRADPPTSHPVVVADVARIVAQRSRRGRLRRWLAGRGPRIRGRELLSRLVADAGQAPLRAVDPGNPALVLHTADGPVEATQRHLVASTFQVRLWIPDMATGSEVVAAARGWWQPGGWVVGPLLATLTAATCQLADADVLGQSVPGATIAFAVPATWEDLVGGGGWRAALGRGDGWADQAGDLRVAGVLLDPGQQPVAHTLVDRLVAATQGARVRHAWQPTAAVGPLLAQPLYGRFHGEPGALPLPDTVLVQRDGHTWAHGPQVLSPTGTDAARDGWTRLDDPALPIRGLLAGPEPDGDQAQADDATAPTAGGTPPTTPTDAATPGHVRPPADDSSEGRP